MAMPSVRVHDTIAVSRTNGPGHRAVVWLQGCSRRCAGCFNPQAHDPAGGRAVPVSALLEWLEGLAAQVDGLTVSGGEPLEQPGPLEALLEAVRERLGLPVLLFTGWTWTEIEAAPAARRCVRLTDAVVTGPFVGELASPAGLWGSSNQELHLISGRLGVADFSGAPDAEVWILPDGGVVMTGLHPPLALATELGAPGHTAVRPGASALPRPERGAQSSGAFRR